VDIRISHAELKAELLAALGSIWIRRYPGTILSLEHLTLRWDSGARLEQGQYGTGREFIRAHFVGLNGKGTRTSNPSKKALLVHVQVDHAVVLAAEDQLEAQEMAAQQYQGYEVGPPGGRRTKVSRI
jgi:hypothetical protein